MFNIFYLEPVRIKDIKNPLQVNINTYIRDDIYNIKYIVNLRGNKAHYEYLVK